MAFLLFPSPKISTLLICFASFLLGGQAAANSLLTISAARLVNDESLRTSQNRDIEVFLDRSSRDSTSPRFLIQAGLHGNERLPVEFVRWLMTRYEQGNSLLNQLPVGTSVDFLPIASPDGYAAATRENAKGVNLNRNFSVLWGVSREYNGPSPLSEPETRAIDAIFQARQYVAAVDIHGYTNWIVIPTAPTALGSQGTNGDMALLYESWSRHFASLIATLGGYELKTAGGLGDGGAFEDHAYWGRGSLSFCLELDERRRFSPPAQLTGFAMIRQIAFGKASEHLGTDHFLKYETAIYNSFRKALELRQAQLASTGAEGGASKSSSSRRSLRRITH